MVGLGGVLLSGSVAFAQDISISIPKPAGLPSDFGLILSGVIQLILVVAGLATFIFLIWGGIQWITSGGDKAGVEAAQHRIQAALLGLFIVIGTWALMLIVEQFFGISILRGIKIKSIGG